jgi:hypothetical protein
LLLRVVDNKSLILWTTLLPLFPGKTTQQINDRWEKVLNPRLIKGSWTGAEDEIILSHVTRHGAKDWVQLAEQLPGRIGKQCRERWTNHLSPLVTRAAWSVDEDEKLIELHGRFGNQWTIIASLLTGRTDNDVKNRWNSSLRLRLERRLKGEPEFRKRGRKPKSERKQGSIVTQSENGQPSSGCETPELEISLDGLQSQGISWPPGPLSIPLTQCRLPSDDHINMSTICRNRDAFVGLFPRGLA